MTPQVVWFKRDLRLSDHQPFYEASQHGPVLCLYVIEDDYWQLPATSNRQWLFVRESLLELAQQLNELGGSLLVLRGSVDESLERLRATLGAFVLYSHQETGNGWTYQRDIQVATWCRQHAVPWHEYAQHGVRRPASDFGGAWQEDWHQHWESWVQQPLLPVPSMVRFVQLQARSSVELPWQLCLDEYDCPGRQQGGRSVGLGLLDSFLAARSQYYQSTISSPLTAEQGCSRLSAHLAYGTVGLREVVARLDLTLRYHPDRQWSKNLRAFRSRLSWHCYFIQKLEANPAAESVNFNRRYDALLRPWDERRFTAWSQGRTGWPLVDASMRYLIWHGWINFRMRAMLVSVACYTLKLPWKPVSDWLARLFVDFEPGIHYPQIQMQSGTTGQQVLRIYNPLKQAQELDSNAFFVRRWLPELANVSDMWIFEPWKMPAAMKLRTGSQLYPQPLVDFVSANRDAKDEITWLRQGVSATRAAIEHANQVEEKGDAKGSAQYSLFDEL
jgi:deoxyribodipyrimidine photo-lyase